jgi:hypothetical protein
MKETTLRKIKNLGVKNKIFVDATFLVQVVARL